VLRNEGRIIILQKSHILDTRILKKTVFSKHRLFTREYRVFFHWSDTNSSISSSSKRIAYV